MKRLKEDVRSLLMATVGGITLAATIITITDNDAFSAVLNLTATFVLLICSYLTLGMWEEEEKKQ